MRKAVPAALIAAAALAAAGCAHRRPQPPPPAPLPVELPRVAFEGAQVDELAFSRAVLTFRCRVDNPNPFPLSVARVRFAVQVEGRPAAQGEVASAFAVPPALPDAVPGSGSISFPVTIRFAAIPGVAQVMATEREAAYALSGAVDFLTPYGVVQVPMAHGGTLALPRPPRFEVLRLAMRSASPAEIVLELRLRVGNTNGYPLPSGSLDYGLVVSGKEVAHATGRLEVPLAPGGSAELAVPIRISVFKAGKAAARFLLPFASLKVGLQGSFAFDGVPVPLALGADVVKEN